MKILLLANLLVGLTLLMPAYSLAPPAHISDIATSPTSGRPVDDLSNVEGKSMRPGIAGSVRIIDPRLLCAGYVSPVPVKSDTIELVARSKSGVETFIPVWFVSSYNCVSFSGIFKTGLAPGTYSLTLTYCQERPLGPGCASLPAVVNVEHGGLTTVNIDIVLVCNTSDGCIWDVTITTFPPSEHKQHD